MNYEEALEYIHSISWRGSVPGLTRIRTLLERMGDPQKGLKFVHITGTNGKGSTAAMLASILTQAGYRTGLYTSPFIFRFNERMQIDGDSIGDEDLARLITAMREQADAMSEHPSEFEMVTATAMAWFAECDCDIVVLEVGMGGEWDATNVIDTCEAAVFTNIGLDHTQYLGDTIEAIARTKSGILKPGCDCVLYHQGKTAEAVIREACERLNIEVHLADVSSIHPQSHDIRGQVFDWRDLRSLEIPLAGRHQLHNACTVLTCVDVLRERGWLISDESLRRGLKRTRWPGRFQVVGEKPCFIIDGGHNPQCIQALAEALERELPGAHPVFLLGCMADKDHGTMFAPLSDLAKGIVTVTPDNPRSLAAAALAEELNALGAKAAPAEDIASGVRAAKALAGEDGVVCACGSLYMIGDIVKALEA